MIVYVALSDGWWLPGNQVIEPAGSPTATAPSPVRSQPSCEPSASVIDSGTPAYLTVVRNSAPSRISSRGRSVSSFPARLTAAGSPSTVAPATVRPARSRLKALRSWVARAVISAVPSSRPVPGS